VSDVFWEAQDDDRHEEPEAVHRRPWWVVAGTVVNAVMLFAVIPAGILALIPFFFLIYVYFAQVIVWVSPLLVVLDAAVFWWGFTRKRAASTALAAVGLAVVAVSFVVLMLWQAQIVILGIPF
jgi:hypothetical protein